MAIVLCNISRMSPFASDCLLMGSYSKAIRRSAEFGAVLGQYNVQKQFRIQFAISFRSVCKSHCDHHLNRISEAIVKHSAQVRDQRVAGL